MKAKMKTVTVLCAALGAAQVVLAHAAEITGAGATFPYPLYAKWADSYKKQTGVGLNYQSIGSGGGIKQIQARTVTFGASDMPLGAGDLDKHGLVQFPTALGGVVPVVNVPGIASGQLTLDGPTLAKIFGGELKSWNDAAIKALNPDVNLPAQAIAIVHRSDGSGTTFLFTNYLSQVNTIWKSKVGSSTSVRWPTGIGAKGNEGVANMVAQTRGAIGYVEYAYVKQNKLAFARLASRDGKSLAPEAKSFAAAAANADWIGTPGFGVILTGQSGAEAWPVVGATFILMHKQPREPAAAAEVLKFFAWAYANGGAMAEELDYVSLPAPVAAAVQKMWASEIKDGSGAPLYSPAR